MLATDIPLVGDWDGNGISTPGFFRPTDSTWHLYNTFTSGKEDFPIIQYGQPGDLPLVGDWDATGRDLPAIYRPAVRLLVIRMNLFPESNRIREIYPLLEGKAVAGNWSGFGSESVTFVQDGKWLVYPFSVDCRPPNPPTPLNFPVGDGIPLAGQWDLR
jgi:hypothetical protein